MSTRPLLDSIPERRSSGGIHARKKLQQLSPHNLFNGLGANFAMSSSTAYDGIVIMLNSQDEEERDNLTRGWRDHKLEELNFVGTVGALLASCLSSTSAWPDVLNNGRDKPWSVRAIWFSGLVFALFAVIIAGLQSMRLHRLSSHRDGLRKIRAGLARRHGPEGYKPYRLQIYAWEASQVFLVLSVALMVTGVAVLVWVSTEYGPNKPIGHGWWDENSKMAVTFTSVLAFALIVLFASQISLSGTNEDSDKDY